MSYIRLNLIDFNKTVSGEVHGGVGDAVIAALSAEPETIGELELATARFMKATDGQSDLHGLQRGEDFEPYDAGIVIVDLAARIVMLDSTYSAPQPMSGSTLEEKAALVDTEAEQAMFTGYAETQPDPQPRIRQREPPTTYGIHYHNGHYSTDIYLPYRLPEDWIFIYSVPEYKYACMARRAERSRIEWTDYRAVLFGEPLCTFIAKELLSASDLEAEDLFTEIHARWLTTAREDLNGRSPREVLLDKMEFIDFDLHSRQLQWSFTDECPPSLLPTSHAYRFGGFGTHEIVIYYDLVRLLMSASRGRLREGKTFTVDDEAARLAKIRDTWLETTNDEYHHKPPGLLIEWERKRTPLAISGKDAMIDDDCPMCQAMADDLGPYFWHLDGSGMDDRFEFSFHKTIEDWEAERREWEEFSREYNRKKELEKEMTIRTSA